MRRRLWVTAAAAAVLAAGPGCGESDDGGRSASATTARAVGKDVAGSVVQFADCGDWRAGSRADRLLTVKRLRGQLTPQRSKSAASPLPDERAYEMLDKTCATSASKSLRLYKLYVRMQGFAPLGE